MTDQETSWEMPERILAYTDHDFERGWCASPDLIQLWKEASAAREFNDYIRLQKYESALTVIEKAEAALKTWKLYMPITDGDTIYSGHPKAQCAEALAAIEKFREGQ